jgi:MerR family transcriptional regulator, thiopeptide resistance regulator
MNTYSISQLARSFGLSRSTLLYYDRIGLLRAPERTTAGYRCFTQREYHILERICMFRRAGLALADVRKLISNTTVPSVGILEKRLRELEGQIVFLRGQQHSIVAMLKEMNSGTYGPIVDKNMWVKILEAAGMDELSMAKWHAEFESRAPVAHFDFLLSIGIPEDEARQIQEWSRGIKSM